MIHNWQFFHWTCLKIIQACLLNTLNIANAISEHAWVFYACSLNILGNSNIIYNFQASSESMCEMAWECSEKILKRVQLNSCKLWSILPDED
jgi:hypothetical protein